MSELRIKINKVIFDLRLFSEAEVDNYKSRMSGATEDQLEAILKEAKELESERWKTYQENKFQIA